MAVHKLLENVLESLSSDNNLSSWTVYKENNGYITLKIRYSEVTNPSNRVVEGHYRRKSQRQMDRDSERRRQWQVGHRADQGPSQTGDGQQEQTEQHAVQGPPQNTDSSPKKRHAAPPPSDAPLVVKPALSPIMTRSKVLASTIDDTPEIARHNVNNDISPILEISVSSGLNSSFTEKQLDVMSTTDNDSTELHEPKRTEDGTIDAHTDSEADDIYETEAPWEPPPGFCWACWMDKMGSKCPKHVGEQD